LIELLRLQGFHNAYAGIMLPNLASAALHEKFGFRHFATFERIGWKLGRWRDVGWWEPKLQPEQGEDAPAEPRAFAAVQKEERASVSIILGR
jgi:phosphinothricin acetyltransferase